MQFVHGGNLSRVFAVWSVTVNFYSERFTINNYMAPAKLQHTCSNIQHKPPIFGYL